MKSKQVASRRRFIWKAGAALSAPLAVGAAQASAVKADDTQALQAELAARDDLMSIRTLQQNLARYINAADEQRVAALFLRAAASSDLKGIRHMAPADFGEHDSVEFTADGLTAIAELHCAVEAETPIDIDCTAAEMAHQQGDGVLRRKETRVLRMRMVRHQGSWKIQSFRFR